VGQILFLVQLQQRAVGEAETLTKVELLAVLVVVAARQAQ
jgi:predicted transcriptional regulator